MWQKPSHGEDLVVGLVEVVVALVVVVVVVLIVVALVVVALVVVGFVVVVGLVVVVASLVLVVDNLEVVDEILLWAFMLCIIKQLNKKIENIIIRCIFYSKLVFILNSTTVFIWTSIFLYSCLLKVSITSYQFNRL